MVDSKLRLHNHNHNHVFGEIFGVGTFQTRGQSLGRGGGREEREQAGSKVAFEVATRRWLDNFHLCDDVTEHHDSILFLAASPS